MSKRPSACSDRAWEKILKVSASVPDYSVCWECGKKAQEMTYQYFCKNRQCAEYSCIMSKERWVRVHDRISREGELCAKVCEVTCDELFPEPGPERAVGYTCAAMIRRRNEKSS